MEQLDYVEEAPHKRRGHLTTSIAPAELGELYFAGAPLKQ